MSRKDYNEVARILGETAMRSETREALVTRFVSMFADDNPRFSSSRFREAAEAESDGALWAVLAKLDGCDQPEVFGVWTDHAAALRFCDQLWPQNCRGLIMSRSQQPCLPTSRRTAARSRSSTRK